MKKLFILMLLMNFATLSFAQTKATNKTTPKKPKIEDVLNQQVEMLNARIDSMTIAHQQAMDKVLSETKDNCTSYYDRLDNEMNRMLTKFSWIWGLFGAFIGIVIPVIINKIYERTLKDEMTSLKTYVNQRLKDQDRITASRLREQYNDIEKQIKEQNKTFGKRFAEHKAYIDKVSVEVENYEKSIKINQLLSEAHTILENDSSRAVELYSQVLELDTKNEIALLWRGISYSLLNKGEAALTDLRAALEINPYLARAYNNIGNVYVANDMYELAEENYNNALKINPQYDVVYRNIALIYLKQDKDFDKAELNLNKAIEINCEYIEAYVTRSQMYRRMSELEENEELKNKYKELSLADIKYANRLKHVQDAE